MNDTAINWTELTWNPNSGCEVLTEGCKYCYALTLAEQKRGTAAFPNGFDLTLRPHKLREPYKLKTPSLIFVNSMSDLFWEAIPDEYRDRIVDVIEDTPQHQYQVLTKRPQRMLDYSRRRALPPNFWAGTTIESNRHAGRADIVRQIAVPVRFVSAEPLLDDLIDLDLRGIQWLITGGESGLHLRDAAIRARRGMAEPTPDGWHPIEARMDWVRHLREKCATSGTALWHKQWGGVRPHSAGRILDGRTWDEMPTRHVSLTGAAPAQLSL